MKMNAFEETRNRAKNGQPNFHCNYLGCDMEIESDDLEHRINVMIITTGQIYQYDETICAKYILNASSDKLCRITLDKARKQYPELY